MSLTIREKDKEGNEKIKTEEVFYTKKSLVSALNNALSARSTSDEYKNINAEEVTPYLDLMGGSAPAKKTTGNKKPTQAP